MSPGFATIRGERVCLRALRKDDADDLQAYRCEPEIARYQSWDTDYSLDDAFNLVAEMKEAQFGTRGSWYQVGVTRPDDDVVIGDIGIFFDETDEETAAIGYTLCLAEQGKGRATTALRLLLHHLETEQGIKRVIALTDIRNEPSRRLLGRVGFTAVGVLEQNGFYKGEWCDEIEYLWRAGQ